MNFHEFPVKSCKITGHFTVYLFNFYPFAAASPPLAPAGGYAGKRPAPPVRRDDQGAQRQQRGLGALRGGNASFEDRGMFAEDVSILEAKLRYFLNVFFIK